MRFVLALVRLVLIALAVALLLSWLKGEDVQLAITLPWALYPVSGGFVCARCVIDWDSKKTDAAFLAGLVRIALFFTIVTIAHWGLHGSLAATAVAFVATLALAVYHNDS